MKANRLDDERPDRVPVWYGMFWASPPEIRVTAVGAMHTPRRVPILKDSPLSSGRQRSDAWRMSIFDQKMWQLLIPLQTMVVVRDLDGRDQTVTDVAVLEHYGGRWTIVETFRVT